jgi:uncharacterized DUF497 family protein
MPLVPEYFPGISGFQWDDANNDKNWRRHSVTMSEAEQVFLNRPLLVAEAKRPGQEPRHFALGRTDGDRRLAIVFTIRGPLLRVISARPMSRKERLAYEQAKEA